MDLDFWIRVAGIVASGLNVWGFLVTSERQTKLIFALSSMVWGAQYELLGSTSGMAIMVLTGVRQIVSMRSPQMSHKQKTDWALFFGIAAILLTVVTMEHWQYASIGLVAALIGTWTFFMCSNRAIRQWTLLTNSLWALHAWIFQSWELLACMVLLNFANLIGLWRLRTQTRLAQAAQKQTQPLVTG